VCGVVRGAVFDPVDFAVVVEAREDARREQNFTLVRVPHGLHGDRVVGARQAVDAAPRAHEGQPADEAVDVGRHEDAVAALGVLGRREVELVHRVVPRQRAALEPHLGDGVQNSTDSSVRVEQAEPTQRKWGKRRAGKV
jgi:hypothetical protein